MANKTTSPLSTTRHTPSVHMVRYDVLLKSSESDIRLPVSSQPSATHRLDSTWIKGRPALYQTLQAKLAGWHALMSRLATDVKGAQPTLTVIPRNRLDLSIYPSTPISLNLRDTSVFAVPIIGSMGRYKTARSEPSWSHTALDSIAFLPETFRNRFIFFRTNFSHPVLSPDPAPPESYDKDSRLKKCFWQGYTIYHHSTQEKK
ncbi:hypothetical protein J6590_098061 [Homalodisca vitripennis]|nr:hypothetical protein J6590_098061 [Homalodisca vitripennis]